MNNFNFLLYVKLIRAWLSSGKALNVAQAVSYAAETLTSLAHVDLTGNFGALVFHLLEGLIGSNAHHDATDEHPAGPVMTPGHAVALALAGAEGHDVPSELDPPPVTPAPKAAPKKK